MPSRWGEASHPADAEPDNSLGSVTIAVGIEAAGHLLVASRIVKEGTHGSDNPLRVCAREARCAGSNVPSPPGTFVGPSPMQVVPASPQFLERISKLLWNSLLPTAVKTEPQGQFSFRG